MSKILTCGPEVIDQQQIQRWLEFRGNQESQGFIDFSGNRESVINRLKFGASKTGDPLPWPKTANHIRFRPGEITIWAAANGQGKTSILSQCLIEWVKRGKVAVASFEMSLEQLQEKFVRQALGMRCNREIDEPYINGALDYIKGQYYFYDAEQSGSRIHPESVLAMAVYAADKLKCKHIVIDSLVKCGLDGFDSQLYAKQRDFVDRLTWLAKTYKTHIHLVHHMRKGNSEHEPGDKWDVKGGSEITDLAHNVMLIWRNKPKEKKTQEALPGLPTADVVEQPDNILTVAKQRHGEWEGMIALWFDVDSQQFVERRGEASVQMLPITLAGRGEP
jgi:twinkle protein